MFRRFFAGREAASPAANPASPVTRRSRRSRPGLEDLEGRQLLSVGPHFTVHSHNLGPHFTVHSHNLNAATFDTARHASSETTSGGHPDLRFKFGTVFTTPN